MSRRVTGGRSSYATGAWWRRRPTGHDGGPAGMGSVVAVPPGYLDPIRTFRFLQGDLKPGGIVLDQQMAATLKAHIGDTVKLTPGAGAAPRSFRVSGVAIVTAPDQLFQPLNP